MTPLHAPRVALNPEAVSTEEVLEGAPAEGEAPLHAIMPAMKRAENDIRQLDDAALVNLAQEGERAAFDELFQRYRTKVFSLSYRMTGNTTDAEDLCQEVFLQLMRKIGSFQGRSSFSTWLYRVAINRSRDFLRRKKRSPELTTHDGEPIESGGLDDDQRSAASEPESSAFAVEARELVHRALLELPLSLRTPLVLHELEGLQYQEVARMLHLPVGTVKSRIFRARIKLGEILEPHKEQWD